MKTIVGIVLALAFLAVATEDAAAQSRAGVRCRNGGYLHGRWYCNVMRFTRGEAAKPAKPGGTTGQGR